jgi:hypothetical protein
MNPIRIALGCVLAVSFSLILACSKQDRASSPPSSNSPAQSEAKNSTPVQTPFRAPTPTVEDEALAKGKDFWFHRFKQCGDSIYLKSAQFANDKRWQQFKGVSMTVVLDPQTLTPANRANGYEWTGDAALVFQGQGLARVYVLNGNTMQWGEWYDYHIPQKYYSISLTKKNGNWSIDTHLNVVGAGYGVQSAPFDCREVPR